MASEKQIAANRQNAKKSTGPRTVFGKRRSRRNAFRHGLTAETVIDILEDPADYHALEAAINADYRPRTAFELELVARLVSLLWRLRRAIAIESGLLKIQTANLRKRRTSNREPPDKERLSVFYNQIPSLTPTIEVRLDQQLNCPNKNTETNHVGHFAEARLARFEIARSFLQLANRDDGAFERLGRYEMGLWRQAMQTILLLNSINGNANDKCIDHSDKWMESRHVPRKHRPIRWPPFIPFR